MKIIFMYEYYNVSSDNQISLSTASLSSQSSQKKCFWWIEGSGDDGVK